MNTYNVEVYVRHNFTVEADTLEQAEIEAQNFDEYFADSKVSNLRIWTQDEHFDKVFS